MPSGSLPPCEWRSPQVTLQIRQEGLPQALNPCVVSCGGRQFTSLRVLSRLLQRFGSPFLAGNAGLDKCTALSALAGPLCSESEVRLYWARCCHSTHGSPSPISMAPATQLPPLVLALRELQKDSEPSVVSAAVRSSEEVLRYCGTKINPHIFSN